MTDGPSPEGSVVVVRTASARARVAGLPGAKLVTELEPPETLYLRVLRSGALTSVLRATRPPERFAEYGGKTAPWKVFIYRMR